jgi:tRNA dimethylallyltransferase
LELAAQQAIEIISIDSALVYRDMDTGTAKPTPAERASVAHHLIDVIDPTDTLSVADTCRQVQCAAESIVQRGKTPVCVGGTMMTVHALLNGLSDLPEADVHIRQTLDAQASEIGWPAMHARLSTLDPESAQKIKPNDAQRIQRALEVYAVLGTPLSQVQGRRTQFLSGFSPQLCLLLPEDRTALHLRIEQRLRSMFELGLVEEVQGLQKKYKLDAQMTSMRAVGYRQVWAHLAGELTWAECQAQSLFATRQLAKRQITWMRSILRDLQGTACQVIDPFKNPLRNLRIN